MRHVFSLNMSGVSKNIERELDQNKSNQVNVQYQVLSAEGSRISRTSIKPSNIPGTEKYINYAISIALAFAAKMGDHKLYKAIKRFEKYDKQVYEQGFLAARTAFDARKSKDSRSKRVKEKEQEIKDVTSDRKLSNKEKKKKLVALEKEISDIIYQGKKFQKKYERKYGKYLNKARKFAPESLRETFNKVEGILREIWEFGIIQKLDQKESEERRKTGSYEIGEIFYKTDSEKLDELYAHLEELFYSKEQNKKR